jgi:hypothetical protein
MYISFLEFIVAFKYTFSFVTKPIKCSHEIAKAAQTVQNLLLETKHFHLRVTCMQQEYYCWWKYIAVDKALIQNDSEGIYCVDVERHYKMCDVFGMEY